MNHSILKQIYNHSKSNHTFAAPYVVEHELILKFDYVYRHLSQRHEEHALKIKHQNCFKWRIVQGKSSQNLHFLLFNRIYTRNRVNVERKKIDNPWLVCKLPRHSGGERRLFINSCMLQRRDCRGRFFFYIFWIFEFVFKDHERNIFEISPKLSCQRIHEHILLQCHFDVVSVLLCLHHSYFYCLQLLSSFILIYFFIHCFLFLSFH